VSDESIKREFRNPGTEWRGAPFWSWNDDLDPDELRWQVREMKRAGMGGFFMHNRIGLVTPYMGKRWMECIGATVDEARKQGMKAWLYDEDRWPSGFGGGGVIKANPDAFGSKYLELAPKDKRGEYRFAVSQAEGGVSYRPLAKGERPKKGEELQQFLTAHALPNGWFNDGPYADNMEPGSVRTFIKLCYEPYRMFAKDFGKTIPGIFTDEPNIGAEEGPYPAPRLPWTWRLPAEFKKRRGYDLMRKLPELFSSDPAHFRTRHDYWRTVAELFAEAYTGQLGAWCGEHGLELTGHMLAEQEFDGQIPCGGAAMPSLEHMQRPGIDILCEQVRETLTCKQASSVAHQMGRKRTLSETYGTSGWHFTFDAQKWSGDWQTVLGINTRCQHLTPYSLRGMRKRDYPPTFFYHQPWWKYFRTAEDYFARATLFTTVGEPVREVLLLHSVSTGWGLVGDERRAIGERLLATAEDLLALHYDFDLGDEIIISRHGQVKGKQFLIGKAAYKLIVIPESDTLFRSTAALLKTFLDAGGKVICMRRRPTRLDGAPAPELDALFAHPNVTHIAAKRGELEDALRDLLPHRISIYADSGRQVSSVIYHEAVQRGRRYVMLANRDRQAGSDLTVEFAGVAGVERWDLEAGKVAPYPARAVQGRTVISLHLPATGSAAFVLDPKVKPLARLAPPAAVVKEIPLPETWEVSRSLENSLPLDLCQWRFARGKWSEPMPVLLAQKQLRAEMGLLDISGSGIAQPWVRYAQPSPVPPRRVEVRFTFRVDKLPETGLDLVVESAELFQAFVNGKLVDTADAGWWLEKSMDRVPLEHVKRGENELVLRCEYRDAPEYELEECYLIGEFGVDRRTDAVTSEPATITAGDWCDQGYAYYAGNLFYGQEVNLRLKKGERAVLRVGPHFAACLAVHVNGELAGVRGWAPYEVDITKHVKAGSNRIEIEVCGSPRNLLGPSHFREKRPAWTGPGEFIQFGEWAKARNLVPYGLFGEVVVRVER